MEKDVNDELERKNKRDGWNGEKGSRKEEDWIINKNNRKRLRIWNI